MARIAQAPAHIRHTRGGQQILPDSESEYPAGTHAWCAHEPSAVARPPEPAVRFCLAVRRGATRLRREFSRNAFAAIGGAHLLGKPGTPHHHASLLTSTAHRILR